MQKRNRKRNALILLVLLLFADIFGTAPFAGGQRVEAAGTYSIYIEGESNYDYAQAVLDKVNREREKAGAEALVMNQELQKAAMRRAAELAIKYAHVRPNGKICFSASDLIYGENIAVGQTTPAMVMKAWMKSKGHRTNILNEAYTAIGIGVFYHNKHYYWVQCFGYVDGEAYEKNGTEEKTYKISIKGKLNYRIAGKKSITMKKGGTKALELKVTDFYQSKILAKSGKWSSSKPSVVTVSKSGKLKAKKKGTAVISCKLGNVTQKVTVKVK
ncbi:MAG: CAP domain-containing protein [Lachnospiraceae bacterium]|nr:CAP domain-containing protein [Lachnospiraceae bacterium]